MIISLVLAPIYTVPMVILAGNFGIQMTYERENTWDEACIDSGNS